MKLKQSDGLLTGCVYRSPASDMENNVMLNDLLRIVISLNDSHLLIVGDFNFRDINLSLRRSYSSYDHESSKFIEAVKTVIYFNSSLSQQDLEKDKLLRYYTWPFQTKNLW